MLLSLAAVAITAKALTCLMSIQMALITVKIVVIVPWAMGRQWSAVDMNSGIGSFDAVKIPMTSAPGARRVGIIVTGGAVLDIVAGGGAVFHSPYGGGVIQWHAQIGVVAVITKGSGVMAFAAIDRFALGVKAVSELVIQVMNPSGGIVAAMTINAI